jgi:hypothetical protein
MTGPNMIHEQPGLGVKWPLDKTRKLAPLVGPDGAQHRLATWVEDAIGNAVGLVGPRGEILSGAVDVRAFGAVGDGVADDTAAIQAALNAAAQIGATAVFPSGQYRVVAGVAVNSDNVSIDLGNATIINDGAAFAFAFGVTADAPQRNGLRIRGGRFVQSDPSTTSNRNYIRVAGTRRFRIEGCRMDNVSNGGIYVEAGCEDGVIDSVSIVGGTGNATVRGIWLNGSTATDYAAQLVDITSITRNATAVPASAVRNVRVANSSIVLPAYGIYLINTRDCKIDGNYIDITGGALRCLALNNYSPGAIVKGNTFIGDRSSTGILVTQASHDVVIDNNVFEGTFGGGRDIYVQYLAECLIQGNRFSTDSTQQVHIDMGGSAVVRGNISGRSAYSANARFVLIETMPESIAGTSTFGNTATMLPGSVIADNVVRVRVAPVVVRTPTSASGNIPGLETLLVKGNAFFNFNTAAGADEFGMRVSANGSTHVVKAAYFDNVVYPEAAAGRNTLSVAGSGISIVRSDAQTATFRITAPVSGGAITVEKLFGGFFSCAASRSANEIVVAPRTIAANSGAEVAIPVGIFDVLGNSYFFRVYRSGTTYRVLAFDSDGTQIPLGSVAATFDVTIAGSAT